MGEEGGDLEGLMVEGEGRGGNALWSCFSRERVLEWKSGPDCVYPEKGISIGVKIRGARCGGLDWEKGRDTM